VREILEMLEGELNRVPRLDKIEKMKMKGKIRLQGNWLAAFGNPNPDKIIEKLEDRLHGLFSLYPYGFSERLKEEIGMRLASSSAR
jgi:hypothetical protein